ncbi:MAG: HAD family phosphatase [Oscillospiraceae bacterium]|nr:HAD family phosphatase [Oscillospiraceae bacterium]
MINTVIFDIGKVLVDFDYEPYVRELFEDETVAERVLKAVWGTGFWSELDYGRDKEEVISEILSADPGYEREIRMTVENIGRCMGLRGYAIPWIKELKSRGYRVLYLSNYSKHVMNARPDVLAFLPLTDGGVFSCDVGAIKPDPAIFGIICEKYGLDPGKCVFIDDNPDNIESARVFGMRTVHFTEYEKAKAELEKELKK